MIEKNYAEKKETKGNKMKDESIGYLDAMAREIDFLDRDNEEDRNGAYYERMKRCIQCIKNLRQTIYILKKEIEKEEIDKLYYLKIRSTDSGMENLKNFIRHEDGIIFYDLEDPKKQPQVF
jgi:hypothetical protein